MAAPLQRTNRRRGERKKLLKLEADGAYEDLQLLFDDDCWQKRSRPIHALLEEGQCNSFF